MSIYEKFFGKKPKPFAPQGTPGELGGALRVMRAHDGPVTAVGFDSAAQVALTGDAEGNVASQGVVAVVRTGRELISADSEGRLVFRNTRSAEQGFGNSATENFGDGQSKGRLRSPLGERNGHRRVQSKDSGSRFQPRWSLSGSRRPERDRRTRWSCMDRSDATPRPPRPHWHARVFSHRPRARSLEWLPPIRIAR